MKKITSCVVMSFLALTAIAQSYYPDSQNPEIFRYSDRQQPVRKEIVLPVVNGYNVYKADLHTHTVFSDGSVMPNIRLEEAWYDGLDIMAVTEHIEIRSKEEIFVDYLEKYRAKKHATALNNRIWSEPATKEGIMVDLNYCVRLSQEEAEKYGIVIIPGSEITRDGKTVGHFNALFTTDNNLIYDPDPLVAIRNAKAQNALVMHNHPGWKRTDIDYTDVERAAYDEGLIDGVEVMNSSSFYPGIIDRALEKGLFMAANTDIHRTTANSYGLCGVHRVMTLILAKDNSLESIREALESNRTISYAYNTLCGSEQLLKDFFTAGVHVRVIRKTEKGTQLAVTNMTSVAYTIREEGKNMQKLSPFSTIRTTVDADSDILRFKVENMFCGSDIHPVVEYKL